MTFKLDPLYRLGAWGAAACMLAICGMVTFQVLLRCLDAFLVLVGASRLGRPRRCFREAAGQGRDLSLSGKPKFII